MNKKGGENETVPFKEKLWHDSTKKLTSADNNKQKQYNRPVTKCSFLVWYKVYEA